MTTLRIKGNEAFCEGKKLYDFQSYTEGADTVTFRLSERMTVSVGKQRVVFDKDAQVAVAEKPKKVRAKKNDTA